jgi:hypothetical protein
VTQHERATAAVDAIINDLSDRRGLKREWAQIDPDIQQEIRDTWTALIVKAMLGSTP